MILSWQWNFVCNSEMALDVLYRPEEFREQKPQKPCLITKIEITEGQTLFCETDTTAVIHPSLSIKVAPHSLRLPSRKAMTLAEYVSDPFIRVELSL